MKQQIKLYPQSKVLRKLPLNFDDSDRLLFYPEDFAFNIPEITIDMFEHVKVLHHYLFQNNSLLQGYTARTKPGLKERMALQLKLNLYPAQKAKEVFCGINQWGNNYFHWITEVLPVLFAFHQLKPTIPVVLPEAYQKIPFIIQSIDALGLKLIWLKSRNVLKADQLYATKLPKVGQYSVPLLQNMATAFASPTIATPYKKIYISRAKAKRRTIANETEVIKLLSSYGFEIVCFEELSWLQQIELMQQTKLLISCHGAGLTNCLFMPKGGTVVELRAANNDYNCFYTLADLGGHRYYYQLCKPLEENHRDSDIETDIVKLESLLKEIATNPTHATAVH
jgi:capsular polysaccharide biosynthesis protein